MQTLSKNPDTTAIRNRLAALQRSHRELTQSYKSQGFLTHITTQKALEDMEAAITDMLLMSADICSSSFALALPPNTMVEFLWSPAGGGSSWVQGRIVETTWNSVQIASLRPSGQEILIRLKLPFQMRAAKILEG